MADKDVRRLLNEENPSAWSLAVRSPKFGPDDMDYLVDRMKAEPDKKLPGVLNLVLHNEFKPHHLESLMGIRRQLPLGSYEDDHSTKGVVPTYGENLRDLMYRQQKDYGDVVIRNVLADPKSWAPGEGHNITDALASHPAFGPEHVQPMLDAVAAHPHLDGVPYALTQGPTTGPTTTPEHVDAWTNWAMKHRDVPGASIWTEHLAQHPKLSDAAFQKLATSDHPRRDALQHRQMSDSQLKAFLSDPKFSDPTELGFGGVAQANAVHNQKTVSPENLDFASRSRHPTVRAEAGGHPSASPELLEKLARKDSHPAVLSRIVQNPKAPPHVIDSVVRYAFDEYADNANREPARDMLEQAAENPRLSAETINHMIAADPQAAPNSGHHADDFLRQRLRTKLATHPNLTPEQAHDLATDPLADTALRTLMQRPEPELVRAAFNNPALKGANKFRVRSDILNDQKWSSHLGESELRNWYAGDPTFENTDHNAISAAMRHPALPQDIVDSAMADDDRRPLIVANPRVDAARLHDLITKSGDKPSILEAIRHNPNINHDHLVAASRDTSDSILGAVAAHRRSSPELVHSIYEKTGKGAVDPKDNYPYSLAHIGITQSPNVSAATLDAALNDNNFERAAHETAMRHPNIGDDSLQRMGQLGHGLAKEIYGQRHPDSVFDASERVAVKTGVGKLRRIRDLILEKNPTGGEVKPKDLPPGDWSAGRVGNGNISAAKLQQHIDAAPANDFNVSHSEWRGAQRHSQEPSRVLQVNLTDEHVRKMKEAGVFPTFLSMQEATQSSGHPILPGHTIGWVRYTGGPGRIGGQEKGEPGGIHVDEIQSDFGQSFVKQATAQAAAQGDDPVAAAAEAEAKWPEAHHKIISNILFGGKHPNEVVGEAFMQHLRQKGLHNVPVHIHDAETKAPLSGMDPEKPLPGHMKFTYSELPKKMGAQPSTYGKLPTQSTPSLHGKPSWETKVRKFEDDLSQWLDDQGISTGDVQAQLGLGGLVDQYRHAISALGLRPPEAAALHRSLVKHDDIVVALRELMPALNLDLVGSINSLNRAEPEPTADRPPTSIIPETPSAIPVAEGLKRAFSRGHVKNVFLGGKHSAGSMIARDPEGGDRWLLKPGSGGQSPARGVNEEVASQARREAGFWHIACLLGMSNDLPRAEVVNMDGHDWAALSFLGEGWKNFDDVRRAQPGVAAEALERLRRHGHLHRWAVLDWITGNVDRHGANLMLGPGGSVKLIDHGSAFAGPSFDPAHDPDSFIPFYLRYTVPRWSKVPTEEKPDAMAAIRPQQDADLREWVMGIDADAVAHVCRRDGLNPDPVVARLKHLQLLASEDFAKVGKFYLIINKMWSVV